MNTYQTNAQSTLLQDLSFGKSQNEIVVCLFLEAVKTTEYQNKWISAVVITERINKLFGAIIPDDLVVDPSKLNRCLAHDYRFKNTMDNHNLPNSTGIFRGTFYPTTYDKSTGKKQKKKSLRIYFITTPEKKTPLPVYGLESVVMDIDNISSHQTRSCTASSKQSIENVMKKKHDLPTLEIEQRKRICRSSALCKISEVRRISAVHQTLSEKRRQRIHSKQSSNTKVEDKTKPMSTLALDANFIPKEYSYWDESPEACRLFSSCSSRTDGDEDNRSILQIVRDRIRKLQIALQSPEGWRQVLDDSDADTACTAHDIFDIQRKCRFIAIALRFALQHMNEWTWLDCCNAAVKAWNNLTGDDSIVNGETVQRWHHVLRNTGNDCFPNPGKARRTRSANHLPPLLEANPDLTQSLVSFCKENLSQLSAELVASYLHDTALPSLLKTRQSELNQPDFSIEDLLKENRLTKVDVSTIYRWLDRLGFKYEVRKKTYYVDTHENKETTMYRKNWVQRYLSNERRMHRWVQIPLNTASQLLQKRLIPPDIDGYHYKDSNNNEMVEFHVDDSPAFEHMVSTSKFGGNVSVRKNQHEKPIMSIGQDECIFKQYTFTPKSWSAPDGSKAIIPKDEGMGIMISAFVSREFGFGMKISENDLAVINKARENTQYADSEAAITVHGNANKCPLTKSPFTVEFEYGAEKEGYWKYEHMSIQMEDCVDCLKVLYPQFDLHFLFDHSCGHDRQRPDGLNANKMSKGYGGAQPQMRSTIIENEDFLGPFPSTLSVGDIQYMSFQSHDTGPFYLSTMKRMQRKHTIKTGKKIQKQKTKDMLLADLRQVGITNVKGTKAQLSKLADQNGIPLTVEIDEMIEGWHGSPKGMLQVLFERGFIDPARNVSDYTVDGKRDNFNTIIPETSLRALMLSQPDFLDEETMLQYHGRLMGVSVDRTPKCHPELAGEGIEYAWGCAKGAYRRMDIVMKRGKDNFRESVRKSLDNLSILTLPRMRKFSKRARQYIRAYQVIEERQSGNGKTSIVAEKLETQPHITLELIERVVKKFKTHRCASDFDNGFIKEIFNESIAKSTMLATNGSISASFLQPS